MKHTHLTVYIHNGLLSQLQKGILNKFQNAESTPDLNPHSLHYHSTTLPLYHSHLISGRFHLQTKLRKTDTCIFLSEIHILEASFFAMSVFSFLLFAHINDTNSHIKAQNNVNHKAAGVQKVNL
jgi:hypothetical protein